MAARALVGRPAPASGDRRLLTERRVPLQPTDRFVLLQQDDTIMLQRLAAPRVAEVVAAAPDEPALSPDEISDIVHELRAERRSR